MRSVFAETTIKGDVSKREVTEDLSFICSYIDDHSGGCCFGTSLDVPAVPSEDGKALKVNPFVFVSTSSHWTSKGTRHAACEMIDLNADHSSQLLQHWLDQAMSGFMAAVATNKLEKVTSRTKERHEGCSKNATTVTAHAKCVVALMDSASRQDRRRRLNDMARKIGIRRKFRLNQKGKQKKLMKTRKGRKHLKMRRVKKRKTTTVTPPKEEFRVRRSVKSASSYSLKSSDRLTPLSEMARSLTKSIRQFKHKDGGSKDWRELIDEVKEESKRIKARKTIKKMFAKRLAMIQEGTAEGKIDERRPLAMKELDGLDEDDPQALLGEARRAEAKLSKEDSVLRQPLHLIREAVKLGMMASGQNMSGFEDKTLKLFSPRLMIVLPEDENEDKGQVSLLSPSLFSLHGEGKGLEKATSLADGFGLLGKGREHEEWLNFVMEAAGVSDAVEYLKDEKLKKAHGIGIEEEEMRSPSGQPLYFTRDNVTKLYGEKETDKIDIFERLQDTYTQEQIEEQKRQGYFIMKPDQLALIYGASSPYHDEERLKTLTSIPTSALPHHIEENIRAVACMDSFSIVQHEDKRRSRRSVVNMPMVLKPFIGQSATLSQPIILSPLVLSPSILSPAIFGPVVLGPWVFVPVILSPRAFSPLILNPLIFSPIVLSPLLAHPLILSPGVFNPIVLSPLLLSPFILSPQVFTPLILSPFALNPLILNPMVGSPLILSPFVLSPLIWSPQVLTAVVLSPYALSPLIESKLIASEVVLSPSWLS